MPRSAVGRASRSRLGEQFGRHPLDEHVLRAPTVKIKIDGTKVSRRRPEWRLRGRRQPVEIQIQKQHIDARFPKKPELPPLRMLKDQPANRVFGQMPLSGNPGYLEL